MVFLEFWAGLQSGLYKPGLRNQRFLQHTPGRYFFSGRKTASQSGAGGFIR